MANEYKRSTLKRRLGKGTCLGKSPVKGYTKKPEVRLGGSKPGEEGQGPDLHGNRGGGWILIPMETEKGWGPYGNRSGVPTGKCFRRKPKSRASREVPSPGRV